MPSKKKTEKEVVTSTDETLEEVKNDETQEQTEEIQEQTEKTQEQVTKQEEKMPEDKKEKKIEPKFKVGDLVFIHKDADADLNGFKLFPQYKKYTYTVEAYDANTDVYSLRRLNLSLRLKGELILAPSERAHDSLNRRQF